MRRTLRRENKLKRIKDIRNTILVFLLILSVIYIIYITSQEKDNNSLIIDNIKIEDVLIDESISERILQVRELEKINSEIIGWLEIPGTEISYPVLQGNDNDYYIDHNYKKEYEQDGSIFLDYQYNWEDPSNNLLIYGHNNMNGNMFEQLLKYEDQKYYEEHPVIRFTTDTEDTEYEIISVFRSRVYYKTEENVFRYYFFIDAENEEEYNYYIEESKKASLYNIDKTAVYGEQLLTLSTCEYSQEDGRFVVVAKKVESDV